MYQHIRQIPGTDKLEIIDEQIYSHSIKIRTCPNDLKIFNQLLVNNGWVKRKELILALMKEDNIPKHEAKNTLKGMIEKVEVFWVKLNGTIWLKPSPLGDLHMSEADWADIDKHHELVDKHGIENREEFLKMKEAGVFENE